MAKVYEDAGFRTHNFNMDRFTNLQAILRVRNFVESEQIDVVMAQLLRAEVFGGLGASLARVPLIFAIQNADPYRAKRWFFPHYYLSRFSMRWPMKIVAVSEYIRRFVMSCQGVAGDRIVTIHNAIDPVPFSRLGMERNMVRKEFELKPHEVVIGTVARFETQKGLSYLLEAFRLLSSRHDDIRLVLVGDGPQRKDMDEWIRKEKLQEKIVLTGFRRDCDRIIQAFDIFALPSLWEGLPIVLLASMASAKPVVATNVAGIPEAVEDGVEGLLVPPADLMALVAMIEKLLHNRHLWDTLGANARKRVNEEFSAHIMADKYQLLWDECLSHRNGSN